MRPLLYRTKGLSAWMTQSIERLAIARCAPAARAACSGSCGRPQGGFLAAACARQQHPPSWGRCQQPSQDGQLRRRRICTAQWPCWWPCRCGCRGRVAGAGSGSAAAAAGLQAQLRAQHEQQQAWHEEQQQHAATWRRRWQQGSRQPQWTEAASSSPYDDTHQNQVVQPQPYQHEDRQQAAGLTTAQLQQGLAGGQQHAQRAGSAGRANLSTGPAAEGGALWSAFFDFPEDSDLTDCHPALLQVLISPARFTCRIV
jgi:hypothetical protein